MVHTRTILMISPIPSGMKSFFLDGKEEYSGMPAFKEVFLTILNDERLSKLFLILFVSHSEYGKVIIPDRYKEKIVIKQVIFDIKQPFRSVLRFFKSVYVGFILTRKNRIDRIAGYRSHGSAAAALIGKITRVPNTRRLYGTFLINEVNYSKIGLFFRHPFEYLSFALSGGTLFVTNDGTKGDIVFKKIGSKGLDFRFLLNGIDKDISDKVEVPNLVMPSTYMSYVARLVPWKRQYLLIEALSILKKKSIEFPMCYIVGNNNDQDYYTKLVNLLSKNNLNDEVKLIPGLTAREAHYVIKKSFLTFSLYHTSNLGNVFLEAVSLGTPIIAINDTGSLDQIPRGAFIEIQESSPELIARSIENCLKNPQVLSGVSKEALSFSSHNLDSWVERAAKEVDILLG